MKINKRDFFKYIGVGMVGVATASTALPKSEGIVELPTSGITNEPHSYTKGEYHFDVVDGIKYDSVQLLPNFNIERKCIRLFVNPIGSRCPYSYQIKELGDTNMTQCGMLEAPSSMWIKRVKLSVSEDISKRDFSVVSSFGWNLWLGHKSYAEGSMAFDAKRLNLKSLLGSKELSRKSLEFEYTKGLYIPSMLSFSLTVEPKSDVVIYDGFKINAVLEGVMWRGVS